MTQPLLGLASFTQDHARKTLAILKTKKAKAEGPACSSQDPPPPPAALGQGQCRGAGAHPAVPLPEEDGRAPGRIVLVRRLDSAVGPSSKREA